MVQYIWSDGDIKSDEESDNSAEIFIGMIHEVNKVKDHSVKCMWSPEPNELSFYSAWNSKTQIRDQKTHWKVSVDMQ